MKWWSHGYMIPPFHGMVVSVVNRTTKGHIVATTVIEQITEFLEAFGDHTNTYIVEASTITGGVLEFSGAVAGYWNNNNDEITGSPLIAGWILCMENRKMLRIVQTTNKKCVSIKLTKKR